jgi:hypothetical protein
MRNTTIIKRIVLVSLCSALLFGCSKEETKSNAAASASAPASAASASTAPSATPAPSATASAAPSRPAHECPKDSTGDATFTKPCEAKGKARMMEVAWTGKTDEKGPHFSVTNKSTSVILYGKVAVYFYDKAGKQLEVKDTSSSTPKTLPFHTCSGNMFGGVMKAGEKAVLMFSCVKKDIVPEGTAAIEAEMPMVGFADATDEKKVEWYWRNSELAPEARKKGGGAAPAKK